MNQTIVLNNRPVGKPQLSDFKFVKKAIGQLSAWLSEGKLTYTETVVEGFDLIPQAFLDLFDGKNNGKMIVKI